MVAIPSPVADGATLLQAADGLLDSAVSCLERGDAIGAGARIRHAALLVLTSLAQRVGIRRPFRKLFPRPARIARALYRAKQLDQPTLTAVLELLAVCNAAAHCHGDVCPSHLQTGVPLLRSLTTGGQQS